MSRVIEARAVISAEDKTGAVFDKIAKKINGMTKAANAFQGIKPPQGGGGLVGLGQKGWGSQFQKEIDAMHLSSKQLAKVQRNWEDFHGALAKGPVRFANYVRAIDDWKKTTVGSLKEVGQTMQAHHKQRERLFAGVNSGMTKAGSAGRFAMHAAGIGGGAYLAAHAVRAGAKSVAERAREKIRYEQMGLTDGEERDAESVADRIASRYPSLSRTEVMTDLRKNASRLGGFDRAKEMAEVYAQAKVSNKLSGGDEHELEQVVRAAEGAGAANTPEQFKNFLGGFARAKAANPDYAGSDFAKDFRAAGAAKYGLSDDYMRNVFPVMASHTPGFGVKLATANSALIGGRQTKAAKAKLAEAGLLDKNGNLVDLTGYQKDNFQWTQDHVKPLLEKKGVKFNEHMSEDDKRTTSEWATKNFSAKNTADLIIANLLDASLVERARQRKTKGLDDIPELQGKDPGLAWEGVTKRLNDLAAAAVGAEKSITAMGWLGQAFEDATKQIKAGGVPVNTPLGKVIKTLNTPISEFFPNFGADDPSEQTRVAKMQAQSAELDQRFGSGMSPDQRLLQFDLQQGINAAKNAATMPPIFSQAENDRLKAEYDAEEQRDRRRGYGYSRASSSIPLPMADPRKSGEIPPVQSLEGAEIRVLGTLEPAEVTVRNEVTASSTLIQIVQNVQNLTVKLQGMLNTNGPGSVGLSSPDAAAPSPKGNTGGASGGW